MTWYHRFALLAVTLTLGCGVRKSLPAAAGSEPPPDAAAEATGPDAPSEVPPPHAARPDVALVVAREGDVAFVKGDGSSRTVYRFPSLAADGGAVPVPRVNVTAFGDLVVATTIDWGITDRTCAFQNGRRNCPETDLVVALDLEGRVRWEKRFSGRTDSGDTGVMAHPGADAWTVLLGFFGALLIAPDGAETVLTGEMAGGRPFPGPAVPARMLVAEGDKAKVLFAWWRPDGGVAPTDPPIELRDNIAPFDGGDELSFVGITGDGARAIVHARPDRTQVSPGHLELPDSWSLSSSGSWRAVGDGDAFATFDLVTGETSRVSVVLPDGMRALGRPAVGHEGAFMQVLRGDHVGAAYLSTDGASWNAVGRTLGQVEDATVQDVGGTYLVIARGTNDFFVPDEKWTDPPDGQPAPELRQASVQLVRPSTGVAAVIDLAWHPVELSRDGTRAAYWEKGPSSKRLVLHDLVRDVRTPIREMNGAWPDALVLIE